MKKEKMVINVVIKKLESEINKLSSLNNGKSTAPAPITTNAKLASFTNQLGIWYPIFL